MNWLRLKLIFANSQIAAMFAAYSVLVALPNLLKLEEISEESRWKFSLFDLDIDIGMQEIAGAQSWTFLTAALGYLVCGIVTACCMPSSIATHLHISDYIRHKKEASPETKQLTLKPGDQWADDLEWWPPGRFAITSILLFSLLVFVLSFLCSFGLLFAALQR